ncbi:Enoyl-CoA delta isomerase 2 [Halotydeus destructor]|nr:Enoyl-CoA delta isomerase 2 [Halotydeus destructor]
MMNLLNVRRMVFSQRLKHATSRRSFGDQTGNAIAITRPAGGDGVMTIRIDRPEKYNAVNTAMVNTISDQLVGANEDNDVKIVLLTGTGKFFSAGNDLNSLVEVGLESKEFVQVTNEAKSVLIKFVDSLIDLKKPLVAAVNGPAVGLFVTTLPLCDVVWATEDATFQTPFSATALTPEGLSTRTFPAVLGPSLANEMLLFNRKLTADEALKAGFVSSLFQREDFLENVRNKLRTVTRVSSVESMMAAKSLIRTDADRQSLRAVNRIEAEIFMKRWFSPEFKAFLNQFVTRKTK